MNRFFSIGLLLFVLFISTSCALEDLDKGFFDKFSPENEVTASEISNALYGKLAQQDITQYNNNTFAHYEINQRIQGGSILKSADIITSITSKSEFKFQNTVGVLYEIKSEQTIYKENKSETLPPLNYNLYFPIGKEITSPQVSSLIINADDAEKTKYYDLKIETTRVRDPSRSKNSGCTDCFLKGQKISYYEKYSLDGEDKFIFNTVYISTEIPFLWGYFLDEDKKELIAHSITPFFDGVISHCKETWAQFDSGSNDNNVLLKICTVLRDFKKH